MGVRWSVVRGLLGWEPDAPGASARLAPQLPAEWDSLSVANLALAHGSWIAPHQSGGPVATAVCLQLAACVPNFLIQERFDAFNEPWVRDLVTWHPSIDPANGHLSLPDAPGLGIDVNMEVARSHPYDPKAYLNIFQDGWEKRLGQATEPSRP